VRNLEEHPGCAFTSGHYQRIAADGSPLPFAEWQQVPLAEGDPYLGLLHKCYIFPPAAVIYRRSVFKEVGDFDPSVNAVADYDMYLRLARRFPVHHHGDVVVAYRQHGANMTRNAALMLKAAVTLLRSQREHVRGDRVHEQACRAGLQYEQSHWGLPLIDEVRACLREGKLRRALRGMSVLARYYPQGLVLVLSERRLERHRLAWRLQNRKEQLRDREQRLQARQQRLKELARLRESANALERERQEVQWLRKRTRRLRLQVQNLDQKLQDMQGPKVWDTLRKVASSKPNHGK
jgi:hypothetical protein